MASYKHRAAEGAVRDFPAIKLDYDGYKLMLEARALSFGCLYDELVDGGGFGSDGDRYRERYDDCRPAALLRGIYKPFCALPADERRVLALRYWQKMEIAEIADELMFSERTVYRHISRALVRLYHPLLRIQPLLEDWRCGGLEDKKREGA